MRWGVDAMGTVGFRLPLAGHARLGSELSEEWLESLPLVSGLVVVRVVLSQRLAVDLSDLGRELQHALQALRVEVLQVLVAQAVEDRLLQLEQVAQGADARRVGEEVVRRAQRLEQLGGDLDAHEVVHRLVALQDALGVPRADQRAQEREARAVHGEVGRRHEAAKDRVQDRASVRAVRGTDQEREKNTRSDQKETRNESREEETNQNESRHGKEKEKV